MKKIIVIVTFISLCISANAQDAPTEDNSIEAKNTISISFGGSGIFFSAIYERFVMIKEPYKIGVKGGIGSSLSTVLFPHEFNFSAGTSFLYGRHKHHLEIGTSVTSYILEQYNYAEAKTSHELKFLFVPSACYRYQNPQGGFVGRIGISPVIHFNSVTNSFTPWIDASLGWAF